MALFVFIARGVRQQSTMANLQQRITEWWAPLKAALRPGQVAPMPGRNSSGSYANWYQMVRAWAAQFQPISPNEAREGYDNSIVDICLNWICTSWQVAVPQVGVDTPDGFMPLEGGHWLLDLLATPAPDMDGGTLSWAMLSDFLRRGNAYAQIVKTRGGQVASLVYLPAKYIKVVPGSDGRLSHFEYSPNGEQYRMLPDEVLHIRHGIDEENPLQGRSPLAAQYREIVTDNAYSDWAAGLAKNGGIPPVLFTPRAAGDGTVAMTAAEAKTISDQLNEKFRSEPGRARIIPGALEMHKTGLVPNEMALTDVRAMPETRIPAALGLPALLLQLYTGIQKSTFNNFGTAVRLGWEGCIIPMMRVFSGAITRQVLHLDPAAKQKKLRLQYDTSGVRELQTDMTAVREAARADKVAGIITVDEARAEQGLAPDPSLAAAATPQEATTPGATGQPGSPSASKTLPWQQGTVTKREAQSGDIYAAADAFRRRLARNESDALDYLAAEWERATASTRKRLDDILRRLAEAEAAGEPIEARLTLLAERLADLLPQMEDKLAALAERGAAIVENGQRQAMNTTEQSAYDMAKAQGMGTWNRVPSESFEALAGFASDGTPLHDLLTEAFGDYADAVRSGLLTTIAQGGGPKQAAAQIVALTGTARARAETIARTEMLRASREASRRTYQANRDVLSGWVRLSAADIRTCPACWALHGQQHPTDDIMPTHPNCRCVAVPVPADPALRSDIPDGESLFTALSESEQVEILGPGRFEQWKNGLPFTEFADVSSDPRWGPTVDTRRVGAPTAQEIPA